MFVIFYSLLTNEIIWTHETGLSGFVIFYSLLTNEIIWTHETGLSVFVIFYSLLTNKIIWTHETGLSVFVIFYSLLTNVWNGMGRKNLCKKVPGKEVSEKNVEIKTLEKSPNFLKSFEKMSLEIKSCVLDSWDFFP